MGNSVIMYNDEKNSISAILEPLGVTGIVLTGDDQKIIMLNYEPKESFSYGHIKIRPASIEYKGFSHDLTKIVNTKTCEDYPLDNLGTDQQIPSIMTNFDHNNILLAIDGNQISQLNSEVTTFSNSYMKLAPYAISKTSSRINSKIENGKITSQNFIASSKNNVLNLDLTEFINQVNLGSKLSIDKAKEISEGIFEVDPILRSAPLNSNISDANHVHSIKEMILSRTYSGYKNDALKLINNFNISGHSLYKDYFTVVALDIASNFSNVKSLEHRFSEDMSVIVVEKNEPLRLIYETHAEINNKVEFDNDIGGFYRPLDNLIKFEDEDAFIHEVAHAAINILFANEANPYPKDKGEIYDAFKAAENKLIHALINKLGYQKDEIQDSDVLKYYLKTFPETILFHKALKEGSELNLFEKYEFESNLSELGMSNNEALAIAQITSLIFDYDGESFSKELMAKTAELYYKPDADPQILDEILAPINKFVEEYIHPKVLTSLELHKSECLELIDNSNTDINLIGSAEFSFCIDEITGYHLLK